MSTIKNPKEKKLVSLKNDRRNVYGESPTSSRKNIALAKQRSHQQERHSIAEALRSHGGSSSEEDGESVEVTVKDRAIISRLKSFKKWPDAPLRMCFSGKRPAPIQKLRRPRSQKPR